MDTSVDALLLTSYVSGSCSEEERRRVDAWLAEDPTRRWRIRELRRTWEASDPAVPEEILPSERAQRAWQRMETRIKRAARDDTLTGAPARRHAADRRREDCQRRRGRIRNGRLVAAAVLAMLVFAGAGLWIAVDSNDNPEAVFTTGSGERSVARLYDGTTVSLAPQSRLEVVRTTSGYRRVHLHGRAFFDVSRDTTRPFIVQTAGGTRVEVLGTAFDVRAYRPRQTVELAVAEGSVAFKRSRSVYRGTLSQGAVLKAGARARWMGSAAEPSIERKADLDGYLAWRQGRLVFEATPLTRVARELERWYGVRVRVEERRVGADEPSSIAARPLTASFSEESLREVLAVIADVLEVEWYVERDRSPHTIVFRHPSRNTTRQH